MYEKGELIYYGNTGVYRVEDIGPLNHIRGCDPEKKYYKLSSIRRGEVTYVPVDTGLFMRPVLTQREAETLLEQVNELAERRCDSREPRVLRAHYQEMLDAHCSAELFRLIKSVNAKGRRLAAQGKRLGKTDQEYKKRAEALLGEELAVALEVPLDSAQRLVSQALTR
jgi:CarD family transcriptional regulator